MSALTFLLLCAISEAAIADWTPTSTFQGEQSTNNCGMFSNSLTKRGGYLVNIRMTLRLLRLAWKVKVIAAAETSVGLNFTLRKSATAIGVRGLSTNKQYSQAAKGLGHVAFGTIELLCSTLIHILPVPEPVKPEVGMTWRMAAPPVLVDTSGDGFQLTDVSGGINFDFDGDGQSVRTAWTTASSDDAWLILDRNSNGQIDNGSELFGNFSPQPPASEPDGYMALAEYDKLTKGGNSDGKIDPGDAIYNSLRLWRDANHNGVSESTELFTLPSLGLSSIDLDYRESRKHDEYGNLFFYRTKVSTDSSSNFARVVL
jgi:hypothetical protein